MNEIPNTPKIMAICRDMRNRDDYQPLPGLADALVEAGFHDQELLKQLHAPQTKRNAQRLVCTVMGGKHAEAVKYVDEWVAGVRAEDERDLIENEVLKHEYEAELIEEYGRTNPEMTYDFVMGLADGQMGKKLNDWDPFVEVGGRGWQRAFNAEEFWKNYNLITGRHAVKPKWGWHNLFTCNC